mmetsp:Transcript_28891/g.47761  ORF Transcript_28891/g.47761 Transcript_28891/m.47761 type:complete len:233 (+) Transcript_28891:168-866(+)|eukprot:CAMPEP_0119013200 /NCGR_PEP_ID=MMETSP1176-20130426/8125_1 /TAXON_ID=265551 /ORGANISM="Synedropsis recta cf, Strain CCMP1620" /LENGTH=232 /DNA_ID=CAMNT_0006966263 /DNA_START=111 /DNA_END=809 /DNA_ORIENTATION=+
MKEALETTLKRADELMSSSKPEEALPLYQQAWSHADDEEEESKVWILLSTANAAVRCNKVKESKAALGKAYSFVHTGVVVGNPLFHLLVGLTHHLVDVDADEKDENFSKAIVCGGADIFKGEDEQVQTSLKMLKTRLGPPEEGSWEVYEGVSLDTLNGATGYLATLIEEKMGKPLPFVFEEISDDSESDEHDFDTDEEETEEGYKGAAKVLPEQPESKVVIIERQSKRQKCD